MSKRSIPAWADEVRHLHPAAGGATYAERVRAYEEQGLCTSDAQGVVDAEDMREPLDDERCPHGQFLSGAGACAQCGGGAEGPTVDGDRCTDDFERSHGPHVSRICIDCRLPLGADDFPPRCEPCARAYTIKMRE